jgi:hypothetical protein
VPQNAMFTPLVQLASVATANWASSLGITLPNVMP